VNVRHNVGKLETILCYSISYCKDNIKCDSASTVPKCPLNNGVFIIQKRVVKLSNTSTMLFPPITKTLSPCISRVLLVLKLKLCWYVLSFEFKTFFFIFLCLLLVSMTNKMSWLYRALFTT